MYRILRVAQREYSETVRSKTFILGLLMVPVIIVAVILLGEKLGRRGKAPRETIRVTITAPSAELLAKVEAAFGEHNREHPGRMIVAKPLRAEPDDKAVQDEGRRQLRDGRVHVLVVLGDDVTGGSGAVRLYTHEPRPAHLDALWTVESLVREAVVDRRCEVQGLDRALLDKIRDVPIERVELSGDSGDERVQGEGQQVARMMLPFAFMYLIFMGIVGTGQQMLSSIIEEKNSRIVEVLLSAISPFELMAGKIAGLAAIGLTVTSLWALAAYGGARWQGIQIAVSLDLLVYVLIYYVLGFVLFSAILAAIGSVCNTLKETQSLMMPVMLVLIIPLLSWMQLAQNPNGALARGLSFVPPATPMVMVLRLSTGAGVWIGEVVGTIALLAAAVLGTMWIAGKIFRTGILMYGKRPSPREVLRWLAQK
jgi:ABC-2 type transport system permease protein